MIDNEIDQFARRVLAGDGLAQKHDAAREIALLGGIGILTFGFGHGIPVVYQQQLTLGRVKQWLIQDLLTVSARNCTIMPYPCCGADYLLLRLPADCHFAGYVSRASIVAAPMNDVPPYEPLAVVPADDVQRFGAMALERAEATALERLLPTVSLLSMVDVVRSIVGRGVEASDAASATTSAAAFPLDQVTAAVMTAMRTTFVWSASLFSMIGLAHGSPDQRTTTINPANGHRLGLHFDSWDMRPLPERGGCRYRVSVNVGTSDRYFLFVAMTALEALQIAEPSDGAPQNATTIFRAALRARPQTPVFRLRVPPGWAYVAPTDNLPHDGSTIGATGFDFSLHALADFRPLKHFFDASTFFDLR